jgi:hypothetical protein
MLLPLFVHVSSAVSIRGRGVAPGKACGPLKRNRPDLAPADVDGCVLLAERAVPDDVGRILASAGTLTLSGAMLSHVSLLAREFGKPSVSLVGVTPARFAGPDEPGLLILETAAGGTGPATFDEGDIVFIDGLRGGIAIPGGLDRNARASVRRVFGPLAAFGKHPEDDALLQALLAACPPGDDTALAFLLDAALAYRLVPAGTAVRRVLGALRPGAYGPVLAEMTARLAASVFDAASARSERARGDLAAADDVEELQRALRRFETDLDADLHPLVDLGADPDRLELWLEPVLQTAAARQAALETRLADEVRRAIGLPDEAMRARLGGLFRLLRRARAGRLDRAEVQRLHDRLTRILSEERARAGTQLVVTLSPGVRPDRSLLGGKAAGLVEILHALPPGCRSPRGFVVTSAAYRLHLLGETGEKLRLAVEAATDAEVSRRARAALLAGDVPEEVADAIRVAYDALGPVRVAVRSSATIEDGPLGSLAGLFDTYLGIHGLEEIVDRVRWAWSSLWNARAVAALFASGTSPLRADQAVLVQEMIPTRAAGVLFSRDPTGRPDTLLINAGWGLGEGVSQGEIPGDLFWVRRSTGALIACETGLQTHRIEPASDGFGTVEIKLGEGELGRPCLSEDDLARVGTLARTLEEVTGRAQDVEFGFDPAGDLVVFQMRRIVPRRAETS